MKAPFGILWTGFLAIVSLTTFSGAANVSLPSYPLAVKSPYLSTWLPSDQVTNLANAQPQFWAGQSLTWLVLGRIDGVTYSLFGVSDDQIAATAAETQGVTFSSSHTVLYVRAGNVSVSLDFFSPVLPDTSDYASQALPYSYLTVSVTSDDKAQHSIQILTGIDQTWTAQDGQSSLQYYSTDSTAYFTFYNPDEILFTEVSDMASWGTVILASPTTHTNTSNGCGTLAEIYSTFTEYGNLKATSCNSTDLAAFSQDLGNVASTSNATFVVGFERPDAINYLGNSQTGYHRTKWPTIAAALDHVVSSYAVVAAYSWTFDAEVRSRAEAVSHTFGSHYADIVEASVRQTFGAIELTAPLDNITVAPPQVFLKEISSDGNIQTMDVIFQSWPIFISLNPSYIRYLLQPVLSYLELPASIGWPEAWVIHDLGTSYPNATGHHDGVAEQMPVFETSSLFILLQAYQKFTGDTSWTEQYLSLLQGYAEYLVSNSLYPASQLISVDAITATANQTALAMQAAIGLKAASIVTNNHSYASVAASFVKVIYYDALGLDEMYLNQSTHFTYNYGQDDTWNVVFTAFSDVLLDLDTFPSTAWNMQSDWYISQMQELGLPFAGPITDLSYTGSAIEWGLSDWNIVTAAASSLAVQEAVVNTTHAFLTDGLNNIAFGTKYYVEGPSVGEWISNKARSTVGSNFAILAVDQGTWWNDSATKVKRYSLKLDQVALMSREKEIESF